MYHQYEFVKAHVDAVAEGRRQDRRLHAARRGSPAEPGPIRSLIARALVLTGARIHGSTPEIIGDRVILLDPYRDQDLPQAA
ncbi:MAG: hypothetical protein MUQ27_04045 [Acidimicrobiia bacterium]|nr:hypothetical protein [Acidimicrobiia bacterium]